MDLNQSSSQPSIDLVMEWGMDTIIVYHITADNS